MCLIRHAVSVIDHLQTISHIRLSVIKYFTGNITLTRFVCFTHRVRLLSMCTLISATAIGLIGMATSYWHLILLRIMLAVGWVKRCFSKRKSENKNK